MILFKIFQLFLLPSVFIPILIILGLIFLLKFKKTKIEKIGKASAIIGIILYCIFSITPTTDLILKPLENQYQPLRIDELDRADKIVLLLGNQESDILRSSEVLRIYNLQFKTYNIQPKIIISGTSVLNPKESPAKELKVYLSERGILPENIILEDKSRDTFESAKNIKEMMGADSFFLVTSAYHMTRSIEVFQKIGANPIPAPADFKIKKHYTLLDFFPDSNNLEKSDLAFHEYSGILFYRLWHY